MCRSWYRKFVSTYSQDINIYINAKLSQYLRVKIVKFVTYRIFSLTLIKSSAVRFPLGYRN